MSRFGTVTSTSVAVQHPRLEMTLSESAVVHTISETLNHPICTDADHRHCHHQHNEAYGDGPEQFRGHYTWWLECHKRLLSMITCTHAKHGVNHNWVDANCGGCHCGQVNQQYEQYDALVFRCTIPAINWLPLSEVVEHFWSTLDRMVSQGQQYKYILTNWQLVNVIPCGLA